MDCLCCHYNTIEQKQFNKRNNKSFQITNNGLICNKCHCLTCNECLKKFYSLMKQHKNNFHIDTINLFIDITAYVTKGLINPNYIGQ